MKLSKNIIGLILGPLVFSLILIFFEADGLSFQAKCILASTAWMAVWWVTECVPISVTALLPIVLFPLTGGMDLSTTTAAYGHKLVFLFVGGFMIALAIEKWHLHKRLALNIIRMTGSNKSRVILGFMLATAFLSMWISNTATSIMILPVGLAIISQLKDDPNTKENENQIFGKSLMIAIAYSASIGGMATLIGTPPNMVLAGVVEESYGIKLNMFDWMKFGVPLSSLLLMICWIYLTQIAFKFKNEEFSAGRDEIMRQLKKLGNFSNEEIKVLIIFSLTAAGWILRGSIEKIFPLIDDTIIAIFFAVILFIIPTKNDKTDKTLLVWDDTVKLPWGILILFGGGMAIASAFGKSGLALWIADLLQNLEGVSLFLIILIIVTSINLLTEVTSNMATTAMLLPVLVTIALAIEVHPYFLLVSATLAASCAFMLPISTPPNAVVFSSGFLKIEDMFKKGVWMNLISIIIITIIVYYTLPYVFEMTNELLPINQG
ncbi:MAG: SLC13 family permease [Flavobacteriaceae bacterium]|nr:MAG: SLC13/DASS family transporter [Bacteroidota bacterium]|tara:strand:- start:39 stop:1511 length:1473 start_codon:yes stop_codon:yes gene_type:complete